VSRSGADPLARPSRRSPGDPRQRGRLLLGWLFTALLVAIYFALPDGETRGDLPARPDSAEVAGDGRKLDVVDVSPADASPGSAVTVSYTGFEDERRVQVFLGKEPLDVLARQRGSVVVRLPADVPIGRAKIRVSDGDERSKPYDLRVKSTNWRKPFRSLVGGLALLVFGIGVFSRGAREAAGPESARVLARLVGRGPAALLLGAGVGALAQSTTAASSLLSGLVASSLLAVVPAARAFLGAGLGAASAPLVTGLIDPREGLLIVAIGVLWLAFASDRRGTALARLILGAGLIALGLQTLRPGFEPFVQDPTLLSLVASLRGESAWTIAISALLGTGLVALLQGPAPVVVLVLALAQTTAQWDLRTALGVLAGSGLGSAVGALLTIPRSRRGRRLAELYLVLGLLGTVFTAATVEVWSRLADIVVPGVPHEVDWGKRVLLPNLGLHLGVAFALSQLASALLLLPVVPRLGRALERLFPEPRPHELAEVGDVRGVVESGLVRVLDIAEEGVARLSELALEGSRDAGRFAEHRLADAHGRLEELLGGPVLVLPESLDGGVLARAAFANLGLLRALEALHRQTERLTDGRLALAEGSGELVPLPADDREILSEMHALLASGLSAAKAALRERENVDLDAALAREIRMNALEARARTALQAGVRDPVAVQRRLGLLELVDAYETAGNQLYRMMEALADWAVPTSETSAILGAKSGTG
jgi:phosphate:Na+ symporter